MHPETMPWYQSLLQSRKFWLAILALVQTILFHYLPTFPAQVWQAIDAVLVILIASIAYEDGQLKRGSRHNATCPQQHGPYNPPDDWPLDNP